jgi:purine-nucleoside phosphorylase
MSIHISAKEGEVAERVLLPGDPLRAQFIAEKLLSEAVCYTRVRNMLGFTGLYKGQRVSVQGTGMGIPSFSIYANELFKDYGVKRAIRVGTAGALQEEVAVRDIVLASAASTDNASNALRLGAGRFFAPAADFKLLSQAYQLAEKNTGVQAGKSSIHAGTTVSVDQFYSENPEEWKTWAAWSCLCVEMETAELYSLAAKYKREALAILTISDSFITGESTSSQEREQGFIRMATLALDTIIA